MYVKYFNDTDTYWFDQNSVSLSVSFTPVQNDRGLHIKTMETWTLKGQLVGTVDELTGKMNDLRDAFSSGRSVGLYKDNKTTPTHHLLLESETLSGVKVKSFSWGDGKGAEYATRRSFTITLEAEKAITNSSGYDIAFTETIRKVGTGGSKWSFKNRFKGPADKMTTSEQSTVKIIQAGNAVGQYDYPDFPPPAFPEEDEHTDERNTSLDGAEMTKAGTFTNYKISWSYSFEFNHDESATPKLG